jgi:predicted dehydrogenase
MKRLRMAVVGVGHLGKEHARILSGLAGVELVGVVDANLEQAQVIARKHNTQAFDQCWPLLGRVDAVSIVVPTGLHASVAEEFLKRGLPCLIEKPLAASLAQATSLVDLAHANDTFIQVGHIERFNPAYEEVVRRPLQPKMIRSHRAGPFTGRSADVGVVFDLMIHDLDLILTLVQAPVRSVHATGISMFGRHEDLCDARLSFENGCVAEVFASRASPTAVRTMQVWGPEGFADVDFAARRVTLMQPTDAVRRDGLDPQRLDPASRARIREELFERYLPTRTIDGRAQDQLTAELEDFVQAARTKGLPRVTGEAGRDAIALAERIVASCEQHRWDGSSESMAGPHRLPTARGTLFTADAERKAG